MRARLLLLALCALLLPGCQASGGEVSFQPEPAPQSKTAQELLEEQPIDDIRDAFLVDTGGRMGTLLVTAERGEQNLATEFGGFFTTISVWNPTKMDSPIQIMEIEVEGWAFGSHNVVDANFDGYQDFGYMWFRGRIEFWNYWIWDEEQEKFIEEPELEEIPSLWVDPETKTITGWARYSGMGDGESKVYKWLNGELVCVRRIEICPTDFENFDSPFCLTVEDRINGELIEIFRKEFPCDSIECFEEQSKWEDLNYHGEATEN